MPATHPQLQELLRELNAASDHARRLVESADDRQFATKPAANAWSASEALAHLTLTNRGMLAEIDRALDSDQHPSVSDMHRYRMDLLGALLRWTLEPPYRMKVQTTPPFVPPLVQDRRVVLEEFLAQQSDVAARIARAQSHDVTRLRVRSPFNDRVKYNLYAALRILTTHERRHLWQAERALQHAADRASG